MFNIKKVLTNSWISGTVNLMKNVTFIDLWSPCKKRHSAKCIQEARYFVNAACLKSWEA